MMQRISTFGTSLLAAIACSTPFQAFAQLNTEVPDVGGGSTTDLKGAILNVIKYVLTFMTLVAVVVIVVAGIRYIISMGESGEKDKAKNMIIYTIIGLVIILLARAIVTFTIGALGS